MIYFYVISYLALQNTQESSEQPGADTGGGCRGCIPSTRPKKVLTWHLISFKIIAKIFLYCTLLAWDA